MAHLLAFSAGGQDLSRQDWGRLTQPVMIIAAVDAPNMFLDNARLLGQLIPNVELVELTGCDHWAQYERAEEFNRLVGQFLAHHERRTDGDVRSADLQHAGPGAA